jgi:hypothetical protein
MSDRLAEILPALVACNDHAAFSSADCPRCVALDSLARLEAELDAVQARLAACKQMNEKHLAEIVRLAKAEEALRQIAEELDIALDNRRDRHIAQVRAIARAALAGIAETPCDGSKNCPATTHIHGCFAETPE